MTDPADDLIAFAHRTRFEDLPAPVVEAVKGLWGDSLAVAMAGSRDPAAEPVRAQFLAWGGRPESTVWFTSHRLPAPAAALLNSMMIHGLEYDAVHEPSVSHPVALAIPAALAAAEARGEVTGRDLLRATCLGIEIAGRIGGAATGASPFFRSATSGSLGAAVTAGLLLGLDAGRLLHAMGLMLTQAAGSYQGSLDGAEAYEMAPSLMTAAAMVSACLAARGVTGPARVLGGEYGYYRLYEGGRYDPGRLTGRLGEHYEVTRTSLKPYPTGRLTHGAVDAAMLLRPEVAARLDQVEAITALVPRWMHDKVARPVDTRLNTRVDAQRSIPYLVALALLRGAVRIEDMEGAARRDPAVLALARKVEVEVDPDLDAVNTPGPTTLVVGLRGGQEWRHRAELLKGHPENPMSPEERLAKLETCAQAGGFPRRRALALREAVAALDRAPSAAPLLALLAPPA
jgi:2-methylcitrate dehydratase PrpD